MHNERSKKLHIPFNGNLSRSKPLLGNFFYAVTTVKSATFEEMISFRFCNTQLRITKNEVP